MNDAAILAQPHAAAIIDSLVTTLRSPNSRAKLAAAKLILRWAWGPTGAKREAAAETAPAGGLTHDQDQQAVELRRRLLPDRKEPNPSATSCPARHETAAPAGASEPPPPNPAINPMSLEDGAAAPNEDAGAPRATPPCPAAEPPERSPSPLAAPPGTDPPRRDADLMSRALLLARNSAEDAFRRPLPQPPPVEPPWPFMSDEQWWRSRRRLRG